MVGIYLSLPGNLFQGAPNDPFEIDVTLVSTDPSDKLVGFDLGFTLGPWNLTGRDLGAMFTDPVSLDPLKGDLGALINDVRLPLGAGTYDGGRYFFNLTNANVGLYDITVNSNTTWVDGRVFGDNTFSIVQGVTIRVVPEPFSLIWLGYLGYIFKRRRRGPISF